MGKILVLSSIFQNIEVVIHLKKKKKKGCLPIWVLLYTCMMTWSFPAISLLVWPGGRPAYLAVLSLAKTILNLKQITKAKPIK
jgi:hypothetical protein